MKNSITTCVLFFLFIAAKGVAQSFTLSPSISDSKEHRSFLQYVFDRSFLVITNDFVSEPAIKTSEAYVGYPYQTRKIQVYGPSLGLSMNTNGNSPDLPDPSRAVTSGVFVIDSIFKTAFENKSKKTPGLFKMLSKSELDSIAKNESKFDPSMLQVKIIRNNKIVSDWKKVSELRLGPANDQKAPFAIYYGWLEINDRVIVTFRNKKDTSLVSFEFERMAQQQLPFLAKFQRDTTSISYVDFVKQILEKNTKEKENIDKFYEYWPAKFGNGLAGELKKSRIYTDTKLVFWFRKPDPADIDTTSHSRFDFWLNKPTPEYADTTMEYLLSTGPVKDTVWQTTGHTLFLTDFKPGADYTLLIRYKSTPGNIQAYTFYTLPKWYQTTTYKYIIGATVLLSIIALLFLLYRFRLNKEKKKIAQLNYGLRSIRSQLNPHFIFNALSSIQGLINKNDIPGANHYLTEFSSLLRESLRNNDKELVPLDTELKILETYLKLEQLRFHFQYEITVDAAIDKNAVEIPALLLQPLIENAIKHGVAGLHEKGRVSVAFGVNKNNLLVSIADNGNGFMQNTITQGLGLKLTKDRIHLLNQSFKKQPIQLYTESTQNNGTTVHLAFKNWL